MGNEDGSIGEEFCKPKIVGVLSKLWWICV